MEEQNEEPKPVVARSRCKSTKVDHGIVLRCEDYKDHRSAHYNGDVWWPNNEGFPEMSDLGSWWPVFVWVFVLLCVAVMIGLMIWHR